MITAVLPGSTEAAGRTVVAKEASIVEACLVHIRAAKIPQVVEAAIGTDLAQAAALVTVRKVVADPSQAVTVAASLAKVDRTGVEASPSSASEELHIRATLAAAFVVAVETVLGLPSILSDSTIAAPALELKASGFKEQPADTVLQELEEGRSQMVGAASLIRFLDSSKPGLKGW